MKVEENSMLSNYPPLRTRPFDDVFCTDLKRKISRHVSLPAPGKGTETVVTLSELLHHKIQIVVNEAIAEQILALGPSTEAGLPASIQIVESDNVKIVANAIIINEASIGSVLSKDACMDDGGNIVEASTVVSHIPKDDALDQGIRLRRMFGFDCIPLWGSVSVIGKRSEMEDTVAAFPRLVNIPTKMLMNDAENGVTSETLTHRTAHFFGVYDGHGGCQVSNYCRDRIHPVLLEEIKAIEDSAIVGQSSSQKQWEKVFTECFQKVDDEVGGISRQGASVSEPAAPEMVGSTAVVALVCSSHIIVANCGDSRAVLFRGKEAKPLSVDHKPEREDECARIEAAGGKVIRWDGYRVLGVLAMSRSIGDRYLKPSIIPKPDIMFIPRCKDDECLILASDGLWDVMSNQEACEVARKIILMWHRKNGSTPIPDRGKGTDPAAQAAAEYLSMLAIQKGSKDNISVIVVDLKAQRKFKSKP